jgi:uncharacterized membrane protein
MIELPLPLVDIAALVLFVVLWLGYEPWCAGSRGGAARSAGTWT